MPTKIQPEALTLGDGQPKPAGTWDYYGSSDPAHTRTGFVRTEFVSFSLGVFQWVPKYDVRKTKRGPIQGRVSGLVEAAETVYEAARKKIADLQQDQKNG